MSGVIDMEDIENVNDYHSVFARIIETSLNALLNKGSKEARYAMIFSIRYAYVQWKDMIDPEVKLETIEKELDDLKLNELDVDKLTSMMSYYNTKAKMKPVQSADGSAKIFRRLSKPW